MAAENAPSSADEFFNNLSQNPLANAGISIAQTYIGQGDQLLKSQLGGVFSFDAWRYYFNVSTSYVLKKLVMMIFPYPFRGVWQRNFRTSEDQSRLYDPPKDDIYAPDLYIPLMGFITYILFVGFLLGSKGTFKPEMLSVTATACLFFILLEVIVVKFLEYVLFDTTSDFRVYLGHLGAVFIPFEFYIYKGTYE